MYRALSLDFGARDLGFGGQSLVNLYEDSARAVGLQDGSQDIFMWLWYA